MKIEINICWLWTFFNVKIYIKYNNLIIYKYNNLIIYKYTNLINQYKAGDAIYLIQQMLFIQSKWIRVF